MQRMLTQEILDATLQRKEDIVYERTRTRRRLTDLNKELAEIIATEELLRQVVEKEQKQMEKHARLYEEGLEEVANGTQEKHGG